MFNNSPSGTLSDQDIKKGELFCLKNCVVVVVVRVVLVILVRIYFIVFVLGVVLGICVSIA